MTPELQKKIEVVYKQIKKITLCLWCVFALFALDKLIRLFLDGHFGIGYEHCDWYPSVLPIYNGVVATDLILALVCSFVLVALFLVRTMSQKENSIAKREIASSAACPLSDDLTGAQKQKIEQHIHDLPANVNNDNAINMSEVAHVLQALIEMKYISSATSLDYKKLKKWLEEITDGKSVPNSSAFNAALRSAEKLDLGKTKEIIAELIR